MARGYWIAHVDVADLEGYKAYMAANAEPGVLRTGSPSNQSSQFGLSRRLITSRT